MKSFCKTFLYFVCALTLLTSCEQRKTIVNGLDEKEANEIVVFLAGKGIDALKIRAAESGTGGGGLARFDISVSQEYSTEAMAILNANGLPRRRGQTLLNLFAAGGLVPSEMQEKIRYQAGLAEQIATTIRKVDGVLDADIQLSFPEEEAVGGTGAEERQEVTAAVYVKHQGVMDDPNSHLTTKIKRLVSSSINGLDFDNVTVIPDRARFTDVDIKKTQDDKQWVRVWSIILAKESLTRFRVIFFSFCVLLLSLTLTLIWVTWKVFPVLQKHGGFAALFNVSPLKVAAADARRGRGGARTRSARGRRTGKAAEAGDEDKEEDDEEPSDSEEKPEDAS